MHCRGSLVRNDSSVLEGDLEREMREVGIVVRRYKERVCVSKAFVWPNIKTVMGRVVPSLELDIGVC